MNGNEEHAQVRFGDPDFAIRIERALTREDKQQDVPQEFPDVAPQFDPDRDCDVVCKLVQSNATNKERRIWTKHRFEEKLASLRQNVEMKLQDYAWFSRELLEISNNLEDLEEVRGMLKLEKAEIRRLHAKLDHS
jgi:hypothetical protein